MKALLFALLALAAPVRAQPVEPVAKCRFFLPGHDRESTLSFELDYGGSLAGLLAIAGREPKRSYDVSWVDYYRAHLLEIAGSPAPMIANELRVDFPNVHRVSLSQFDLRKNANLEGAAIAEFFGIEGNSLGKGVQVGRQVARCR